jgi:hypothetical protein
MQKITSVAELRNAIQILEAEQAIKGRLLKEQFDLTYESLKPVNIIKRTIKDIASTPYLVNNLIGTLLGLVSGSLSNRVFVGSSGNIFRKLFGTLLQYGVTNAVSKNPDVIKSLGQYIVHYLRRRKDARLKHSEGEGF